MKTKTELMWAARRILQDLIAKHPQHAAKLVQITFKISGRMTQCAGLANCSRSIVKLSLPFFASEENFTKEFFNVVTHEIAHILCPPVRHPGRVKRDSHGYAWQMMHRSLGGTGERCHELEITAGYAKRRTSVKVEMPCYKCGKPIALGPKRAKVYREGIASGSMGPGTQYGYAHRTCP